MYSVRMLESGSDDYCTNEERVTKYCDSNCNTGLVSKQNHFSKKRDNFYQNHTKITLLKIVNTINGHFILNALWHVAKERNFHNDFWKNTQFSFKLKIEAYWPHHFETHSKLFANLLKFEKLIVSNRNVNQAMKIFVFIITGHHG